MRQFADKVALVTGGGSGIGRATAIAFAEGGAKVVVAGRRVEEGAETIGLIEAIGGEGMFVQADVTVSADVERLVGATVDRFDIAFNNAGNGTFGPLIDQDEATFDWMIAGNTKSVFLSMQHEIRQMLRQGGGVIVNNASVLGLVGAGGTSIYTAAKHAVVGLTRAVAMEYAPFGIRINAIAPGPTWTPMPAAIFGTAENYQAVMGSQTAVGRLGESAEQASAVLWLSSPGASYVHGAIVPIDGGMTAK